MMKRKRKLKTRLKFEKEIKPQSDIYHRSPVKNAADMAGMTVLNKAHSKVSETEHENTGIEDRA